MEDKLKEFIEMLKNIALENKSELYIVGGYIRDKLIDPRTSPKDIDFVYGGDILHLIEILSTKGFKFYPIKEDEGIFTSTIYNIQIDISKMKGNSIEEDLSKRDYTINANALSLLDMQMVDLFKGRRAIRSRILQEVNEKSLENDPVRILRGIRLYIKKGFHFSLQTEENVVKFAYMLKNCNGERVFNELMNIIQCDVDGRAFELLDNYKILENLIPYTNELKCVGKCKYHLEDVFSHMDLTYKTYKELLIGRIKLNNFDSIILNEKIENFDLREYIGFACFNHDIGKYVCYRRDGDNISFINHDKAGAKIIEDKCNELKFPKEAINLVAGVVKNHMKPLGLFKLKDEEFLKETYKFFYSTYKYIPYILITSFCDVYSTKIIYDPKCEKILFKEFIEKLFILYKEYSNIINNKWIDGDFIMQNTNKRGEEISNIIYRINELRFLGVINNKNNAQKYILSKYVLEE